MEAATSGINIIPFIPSTAQAARSVMLSNRQNFPNNSLRNATKIFTSIWENSNEGMRLTDGNGIIVAINPAFCRLVGRNSEELVGHLFTSIYADVENREKMIRNYESHFKERQAESHYERRLVLWTNHTINVEINDSYIETDDGRVLLLSRFRDITIEKLTQNALTESESKYRGLFANSVMPMFQSSVDGKLMNANRAMLKLLGYNNFFELADLDIASDIYGNSDERQTVTETLQKKGYVVNAELSLKRKSGKILTVLENARTLHDENGKVIGYEGVLEDITARKAMEKKLQEYVWALEKSKNALAELNAKKDKLFSILSHDLRSPFSSILGFCDILLKENDQLTSEDRVQFVAYIQEGAQDQLALVNKLLDWSRLESGHTRLEQTEIDLQDIAKKSVNSLLGLAHQKQVKLQSTLPANIAVRGDRHMLGQVFGNLIGNSLKFTPAGGAITVELIEEQDDQWVIGVRDTGIGIPEEDVHKLFKIEEKYTRKGLQGEKGTGLGLPVVHEIVSKHNGTIEVKSHSGTGTLFLITLPKSRPGTCENILVVDDEHGMRMLHTRYIKRMLPDANILHASDGAEALQLARDFNPKLIISDNDMPDMNGEEMVRTLKSDPMTANIPIIIVTGQDSDANREALKQYGAYAVLTKPITPEQLAEILENIEAGEVTITL
ncbi:MAG: PAS domain S-box protein [Ignavibacteriales bacterium]|nr:PAS domain S-box protein [Ignavibacteriales bacterium]